MQSFQGLTENSHFEKNPPQRDSRYWVQVFRAPNNDWRRLKNDGSLEYLGKRGRVSEKGLTSRWAKAAHCKAKNLGCWKTRSVRRTIKAALREREDISLSHRLPLNPQHLTHFSSAPLQPSLHHTLCLLELNVIQSAPLMNKKSCSLEWSWSKKQKDEWRKSQTRFLLVSLTFLV